jgi:hypothetical protein
MYTRINSTKSPASGAGNFGGSRLMSQVGRVSEVACGHIEGVSAVRTVELPVLVCSCNHVTEVGRP